MGEEARPVLLERRHEFRMHLRVGRGGKIAGNAREYPAQQAEACGQYQCGKARFPELFSGVPAFQYLVQDNESEHRQCYLQDYQCHGHGPELAVERHVFIPELGERHEMAADSEEYGNDCRGENPPFVLSVAQEKSEKEQENGYCTDIHRSGRERLRSPVERQCFGHFSDIGLAVSLEQFYSFGLGRIDSTCR